MREVSGDFDASELKVGVAVARWNGSITDQLLDGAIDRLAELGAVDVTVLRVPGALEIPLAAKRLIESGCEAVVVIAAVIRGETDHYEIVVRESSSGVSVLSRESGIPIGNAILAVHDVEDAVARAGVGESNKGYEAVDAAVETANALRKL